jgi:hypothetical protein
VGTNKRLQSFHSSTGIIENHYFHAGFLFGSFFNPEDDGDMFLWNAGWLSTNYTDVSEDRILHNHKPCIPNFGLKITKVGTILQMVGQHFGLEILMAVNIKGTTFYALMLCIWNYTVLQPRWPLSSLKLLKKMIVRIWIGLTQVTVPMANFHKPNHVTMPHPFPWKGHPHWAELFLRIWQLLR